MRPAYQGVELIRNDDGEFMGISLGFDFCSEHEWGIQKMKDALGVGTLVKSNMFDISKPITRGIEARQINTNPADIAPKVIFKENNKGNLKYTSLLFHANMYEESKERHMDTINSHISMAKSKYNSQEIMSSWNDRGFCVTGFNDEFRDGIRQIYNGLQNNDLIFGSSLKSWITSSGLSLIVASKIPENVRESVVTSDIDHGNLLKAAKDSKIEQILEKSGKKYFALSPKWRDFFKDPKFESDYPVVFWLNPYEQHKYSFGWYTVEELKQWANDVGPVVEKKKENAPQM